MRIKNIALFLSISFFCTIGLVQSSVADPKSVKFFYNGIDLLAEKIDADPNLAILIYGQPGALPLDFTPPEYPPHFRPEVDVYFKYISPSEYSLEFTSTASNSLTEMAISNEPFANVTSLSDLTFTPLTHVCRKPGTSGCYEHPTIVFKTNGNGSIKFGNFTTLSENFGLQVQREYISLGTIPEINVTHNNLSIPSGTTNPVYYDLGSSPFGLETTATFTIENLGDGNLLLNGSPVTITGFPDFKFRVSAQPNSPIVPGDVSTFTIAWTPSTTDSQTATISIENNDSDEPSYTFNISATGTANGAIGCCTANGPIACYPFNGNANNECGAGYHGTLNGAVLTADRFGDTNKAYYFDGSDRIEIRNFPRIRSFTVVGWVKMDAVSPGRHPVLDNITTSARFEIRCNPHNCELALSDHVSNPLALNPQQWYYIAVSYDATTQNAVYYLNGSNVGTANFSLSDLEGTVYIGEGPTGGHTYFTGAIDDICIYNRVVSAQEIYQPEIHIKQNTLDIYNHGNFDFGTVALGSNKSVIFTVRNYGITNLTLTGNPKVVISGQNAADFLITQQPNSPLVAVASATFTLQFKPQATDERTATIKIANNDSDENPYYTFTVTGGPHSYLLWTK
jgi:hypothetical protein